MCVSKKVASPAWWGHWRSYRRPSPAGRTEPPRCTLRRRRWSPAQCRRLSNYSYGIMLDTSDKSIWFWTRDGSEGSAYRWPRNLPSHWAIFCLKFKKNIYFDIKQMVHEGSHICLRYFQRIWNVSPPYHPAEEASDSVRGCSAKAAPNGFRPNVVLRLGQFCWKRK